MQSKIELKMKTKLKVGDPVLITGSFHYDKALVTKVEKGLITLNNGMQIDQDYYNVKKSECTAQPWDEAEWEYERAIHSYKSNLTCLRDNFSALEKPYAIEVNKKLEKIINKYGLKHL